MLGLFKQGDNHHMRILFDSKQEAFKTPFGCLTPGQTCTLHKIGRASCRERV